MSDIAAAIMDAAERRMRLSGFYGFSFREIAADVGVKSSSVHYHFPTKEKLAAAVIHRYTDEVAEFIDKEAETAPDPVSLWTGAFRGTLCSEERMCPCAVLGAVSKDLPRGLAAEVRRFFKMCLDKMMAAGLSENGASGLLATITGATTCWKTWVRYTGDTPTSIAISDNVQRRPRLEERTSFARSTNFWRPRVLDAAWEVLSPMARRTNVRVRVSASSVSITP
jgi:TetR/AcrR family transcriptional repressor of nem operon